ncbi:hypothetical protein [Tautonia rosea]|uniref:hypothetical protein n=1 Tax=Tautonia rosea TaxID=2728037 RepID=UPI0014728AED|nr:hypothetical protein [Tautonia rosea]
MLDEKSLRRPDFMEGIALRLADGGFWTVPMPPQGLSTSKPLTAARGRTLESFGPRYLALLNAVRDAEDDTEVLRFELALAICLLRQNYQLDPSTLASLLSFTHKDDLTRMQRSMSEVASAHLRAVPPPEEQPHRASEGRVFQSSRARVFST